MTRGAIAAATLWVVTLVAAFVIGTHFPRGSGETGEGRGERAASQSKRPATPDRTTSPRAATGDLAASLAAAQELVATGNPEDMAQAVGNLARDWQPGEAAPILQLCLEAWGGQGGAGAIERLDADSPDAEFRAWALRHLVTGWAKTAPHEALGWATEAGRTATGGGTDAMLAAFRTAARQGETDAATTAAATLAPGGARTAAAEAIVSGTTRGMSGEEARQWFANSGASSPLAIEFLRPLARHMFAEDPGASAAWAASLGNGQQQLAAVGEVAGLWARQAPQDAAAWAQDLPEGDARSSAMTEVVKAWAPEDPQAAGEWLNEIPPTPGVDRPLASYIHEIAVSHPEIAAEWAESIEDPHARYAAVMRVSKVWQRSDPGAALTWRSDVLRR